MSWEIREGDCLESLRAMPAGSVQCCVTSPPYWGLRDYGHGDQLGMEETPDLFVANMVKVFAGVKRVLRDDGTLWLNIGDSYAGPWGNQGRKSERGTQRPINGENVDTRSRWPLPGCRVEHGQDSRWRELQGEGFGRHPVAVGVRPSCRWLVSPFRDHLGETEPDARVRD